MKDYYCPVCQGFFDIPSRWVTPCCGVDSDPDNFNCQKCGEEYGEGYEIPECPHCGNNGDGGYIQPDSVECFKELRA
jgi:rubredoxin